MLAATRRRRRLILKRDDVDDTGGSLTIKAVSTAVVSCCRRREPLLDTLKDAGQPATGHNHARQEQRRTGTCTPINGSGWSEAPDVT